MFHSLPLTITTPFEHKIAATNFRKAIAWSFAPISDTQPTHPDACPEPIQIFKLSRAMVIERTTMNENLHWIYAKTLNWEPLSKYNSIVVSPKQLIWHLPPPHIHTKRDFRSCKTARRQVCVGMGCFIYGYWQNVDVVVVVPMYCG